MPKTKPIKYVSKCCKSEIEFYPDPDAMLFLDSPIKKLMYRCEKCLKRCEIQQY